MKTGKHMLTILILVIVSQVLGQEQESNNKRKEQIESMKIAFFTQKLQLTPEEAAKFWPVFNMYENERKQLKKENRQYLKKEEEIFSLSNEESEKIIQKNIEIRKKELALEEKYMSQFKTILPPQKVVMFIKAERDFGRFLMDQIRKETPQKPLPEPFTHPPR